MQRTFKTQQQENNSKNGAKTWLDTLANKIFVWQLIKWKYVSHHVSSGKYKLKRWDYTATGIAKLQNTWQPTVWGNMWNNRNSHSLMVWMKNGRAVWRHFVSFLENYRYSYDTTIMLLGIYSKKLKTYIYGKTCIEIFMTALFIITKTW